MKYRIPRSFMSCIYKLFIPLSAIAIMMLLVILDGELKYSYNLEHQIYERDSIIEELAYSNNIVKEYFNIKIDTVNNKMIYALKEEKTKHKYEFGNTILSEEDLLNLMNNIL